VQRTVLNVPMPNYYAPLWQYAGLIDRWISYEFRLPATLLMSSGARTAAAAESANGDGVQFHSCQALTPETPHSTHYFFMEAHRANCGDASTTAGLYEGLLAAFEEDRQMITAQAHNLSAATPMVTLPMDKALVFFRRVLEERLQKEQPTDMAVVP
jgi:vanillate O-demethylase monooxygenase subunit